MTKVEDYPVIRGEIIKILYVAHPEWTPRAVLKHALEDRGYPLSDDVFSSEMTYLRDKPEKKDGYVEFRESMVGPAGKREKRYSFRLTPLGIDLYEGRLEGNGAIAL